jgi:hypothetical protein
MAYLLYEEEEGKFDDTVSTDSIKVGVEFHILRCVNKINHHNKLHQNVNSGSSWNFSPTISPKTLLPPASFFKKFHTISLSHLIFSKIFSYYFSLHITFFSKVEK